MSEANGGEKREQTSDDGPMPKRSKGDNDCNQNPVDIEPNDLSDSTGQSDSNGHTVKKSEHHGISEYVNNFHKGFFGILKHRISDFIVNEIDADGCVVKLTDMSIGVERPQDATLDSQEAKHKLKDVIGHENLEKIEKMLAENLEQDGKNCEAESQCPSRETVVPAPEGRDARAALHALIRSAFPALESQTDDVVSDDGNAFVKVIRVKFLVDCLMSTTKGKSRGFLHPGKRSEKWPRDRPEFCHFVLYKENTDTMDAINVVSGNLGIKTGNFVFSGTKDKRGITTQNVSVQKVHAHRLLGLNDKLKCIKIGNCQYKSKSLKLGDNWGNQFRLVLRELKSEERESAVIALGSLKEKGFINYYGMQRFGSTEISTQSIGLCLLRRDWREAIELILKPRANDRNDVGACRKCWAETKDPQKALEKLGRRKCPERCLLSGLIKHAPKNDFCGALNWIPRTTRLMYVHAYQSLIWNSTVSSKVAQHGLSVRAGDLVTRKANSDKIETGDVEVVQEGHESDFSIYDVVMPLVGHDVIFPENESKQWMVDLFTKDDLTLESFNSSVRDYALPGGYRHILVKPKDLDWRFVKYQDEFEPINTLDDDEIAESVFLKSRPPNDQVTKDETSWSLALAMKFSLPSCCYATMAVREILRMEVSTGFQAALMD